MFQSTIMEQTGLVTKDTKMEEWIEEVVYRGRPPSGEGSDLSPGWHVIIGQQVDSPFENGVKQRRLLGPLTIAQALEMGYTLPSVLETLNTSAINEIAELKVELTELKIQYEDPQD